MNNHSMAREYMEWMSTCLDEARDAFSRKRYAVVVRRSQEALELGIKAVLRYMAVEFPREHDVSDAIDLILDRVPQSARETLVSAKPLLRELAKKRGPAMYGLEAAGVPPSRLFTEEDASRILHSVETVTFCCNALLTALKGETTCNEDVLHRSKTHE